jgi:hypothetical protein
MNLNILRQAFQDELIKIAKMRATSSYCENDKEKSAGSLQGHVRSGKRPISALKLLSNERKEIKQKKAVITKLAKSPSLKGQVLRASAVLGAGAGIYKTIQKANDDRKLGKMVRQQQGQ